jgi:hypothetical protein
MLEKNFLRVILDSENFRKFTFLVVFFSSLLQFYSTLISMIDYHLNHSEDRMMRMNFLSSVVPISFSLHACTKVILE